MNCKPIIAAVLAFSLSNGNACKAQTNKAKKPNVLVLVIDDLGYHDLSTKGSKIYQTPNIDKLAAESVNFENAYANFPRCVPSRYSIITGKYPVHNNVVPDDGYELEQIPKSENFIESIKSAGYQTAFFGKWHLGDGNSSPKALGFDISYAAGKAGSPISYFYPFNLPKGNNKKVIKDPVEDIDDTGKEGEYLTDKLTDEVINYIKNKDQTKPFFAVLSYYAVHQPFEAKKQDEERNKTEIQSFDFKNQPEYIKEGFGRTKMRQDNATYAAMVENTDDNVGRLLKVLSNLNIDDNTIVILTSDNGGLSNDGTNKRDLATTNFPLRAGKGHLYEGGVKVPLFIKWNNNFKPHTDANSLVMLMDIYPTVLDIIGQKSLPNKDGLSMLPVLKQNQNWSKRETFWYSPNARPGNTGDSKSMAVRSGNWKLVYFYEKDITELYNLKSDPGENNNLSAKFPQKVKELKDKLVNWERIKNIKK